ncbi:MAG: lysophospholipid acyltransferase family protein [Bryobacteraceae bacterium]
MFRARFITTPLAAATFLGFGASDLLLWLVPPARRWLHVNSRLWSRLLLRLAGVKLVAEGLDRIPQTRPCVLAANHLSYLDTPVMAAAMPVRFRFMAKESLFRMPIVGWHLKRDRHISVRREEPREAARSMVEAVRCLRERVASVLVFAEGTRSGGGLQALKAGAAHIAIKSGAPLVPVVIQGTEDALPRGSLMIRPATVRVRIGDPVEVEGLTSRDRGILTERLEAQFRRLLEA